MKKWLAAAAAALVLAVNSAAQSGPVIASADLRSDLAVLRRAYEELHPGLYRYNTKQQMAAHFAAAEREFARDMTLGEAYLVFSRLLGTVKCGHTYMNFYNQPKSVVAELFKGRNRVPFHFRWLDGRMIVTRGFSSDDRIKAGAEVLEINGTPVKTIIEQMMPIARADGSNDAKRAAYLSVAGTDRWEAFDVYLPLLFPAKEPQMRLKLRPDERSRPVVVTVDPLTDEERLASMKQKADIAKGDEPVFTFEYRDASTAVLRMPNWALYDSKWDWQGFIDQKIDEMIDRKVANLVVDIRENEGGIDVGNAIIARLAKSEVAMSEIKRLVRYRQIPVDLKPYLDTWDRSFDDWGSSAVGPNAEGFYTLTRYDDDARGIVIKPSGRRFEGRVFVLVDAVNSSATFQFAQVMKMNNLGTLVGQPTGGNQRGINGGAFYFLRLPKTKLEADLPLIGQFSVTDAPDAGILPDVHVKPSVADIAAGRDAELEAVMRIIAKRR